MGIVRQCRKCGEDVRPYDLAEQPLCDGCSRSLEAENARLRDLPEEHGPRAARRIPPILRRADVITVRDLKEWVKGLAEVNGMGDDTEVWIDTRDGHSSPCRELSPLNVRDKGTEEASCDVFLGLGER